MDVEEVMDSGLFNSTLKEIFADIERTPDTAQKMKKLNLLLAFVINTPDLPEPMRTGAVLDTLFQRQIRLALKAKGEGMKNG